MEHHERLLVFTVDDEPGIRLGVEAILRGFTLKLRDMDRTVDFAIRSFETGEAFLEALETETPALVLLDCKLPGIGGLEILEQVLSAREDIVTLIVTAYATLETAVKTTKMGAFDFLAKPFTPDELRYTVRKAATHVLLRRERHRLETERRQIRFQFISVLAHELKSPINAVEGYLDLMVNGLLGQELDAYGPMVEKCISRIGGMRKLIADLMDLTRLESGQHKREIQT
ncbi:response regulator, partial [Myxococcota bacterium]|nr:response regulator [Myxococcota bacterium]MBU1534661.1 response regulator [Myxococcota bacterium]